MKMCILIVVVVMAGVYTCQNTLKCVLHMGEVYYI